MNKIPRLLLQFFFGFEVILFMLLYVSGAQGIRAQRRIHAESRQLQSEIVTLATEIALLKKQLLAWQEHPFFQEKVAREQLQMGYDDEIIYVIKKN